MRVLAVLAVLVSTTLARECRVGEAPACAVCDCARGGRVVCSTRGLRAIPCAIPPSTRDLYVCASLCLCRECAYLTRTTHTFPSLLDGNDITILRAGDLNGLSDLRLL